MIYTFFMLLRTGIHGPPCPNRSEIFKFLTALVQSENFKIFFGPGPIRNLKIFPGPAQNFQILFDPGPKFQLFAGPGPIRSEISNSR